MSTFENPFFVLLDLDDTLLDFHAAERSALSGVLESVGLEPREEILTRYSEINRRHWELLEEGKLTRRELLPQRFRVLFAELGLACDGEAMQRSYEKRLSREWPFIPGARELLEALHGRWPLYLVSNGNTAVQDGRIAGSGIARYFEDMFVSERIGSDKPSRAFFDACFARIPAFDPSRALLVGDSLTSDIRGARNAGVRSCWFNPEKKPGRNDIRPDYEIASLAELPPLLERLSAKA